MIKYVNLCWDCILNPSPYKACDIFVLYFFFPLRELHVVCFIRVYFYAIQCTAAFLLKVILLAIVVYYIEVFIVLHIGRCWPVGQCWTCQTELTGRLAVFLRKKRPSWPLCLEKTLSHLILLLTCNTACMCNLRCGHGHLSKHLEWLLEFSRYIFIEQAPWIFLLLWWGQKYWAL